MSNQTIQIPRMHLIDGRTDDGRPIEIIDETFEDQGRRHNWYRRVINHPDHGLLSYGFGYPFDDDTTVWGDAGDDRTVTCMRVRAVTVTVVQYEDIE